MSSAKKQEKLVKLSKEIVRLEPTELNSFASMMCKMVPDFTDEQLDELIKTAEQRIEKLRTKFN